ncbi:MAG: hypothetical protein EBS95_09460, partial [Chitinophagia bacterium]|nr:hypothetical protein [Chitinophagia bacterium]
MVGADINTTYQWRLNNIDITDASARTNNLTLLAVNKSREGAYSVITNNNCGASTLALFKLNITNAPEITTQPVAGYVCEGGSFTNNVIVANAAQLPLSYQWYKDGNIVSNNGSGQQLLLQNIAGADQGLYAVRVSNSCGTTQSSSARLSLVGVPVITQQPSAITSCSGLENAATVVARSDDNRMSYAWYKDGVLVPGQIGAQLVFTKIAAADMGSYRAVVTNGCNLVTSSNTFAVVVNEKISLRETIADKQLCVGSDFEVDISSKLKGVDLSSGYQWQLNGVNVPLPSAQTAKLKLLAVTKTNAGKYALTATNGCGAVNLDLFSLGVTNLPVIETHPIPGGVCENQDWSTQVVVSNNDQVGFVYQWYKNDIPLTGANRPDLFIGNANASHQGLYNVKLSSACGDVISDKALFQIRPKPQIDFSLVGTAPNQCLENNAFLFRPTIQINDNSTVDLTWDFGDGVFSKQNQVSHSYQFANDFRVYLYAKSSYGCLDTASQIVSVNTKPIVTGNITNQIICLGGQLNFNVDVKLKANELVGYQWYFNQEPIANAVNRSIAIDNIQKANAGLYKLRINNACGISYSTEAELKVAEKPLVTVPLPIDRKVCEGEEFVLKPTVYSLLPNTYQWFKNGLPSVGQELDSLRIIRFAKGDVATYAVGISNRCGSTQSADGNLIMKNIPTATQALLRDTICYQTDTKLMMREYFNNDDTLQFAWYKDGELVKGYDTRDFAISKFNAFNQGFYAIRLSNTCGNLDVPVARLVLNKVDALFRLDTTDACKGSLNISALDTTRSLFKIVDNYWDIKEMKKVLGITPAINYQFSNSGLYTIRHAVVDAKGCVSDTLSKTVVNYGKPTAMFTMNDTCMTLPSIPVNHAVFGFGSSKLVKYTWNFGDTVIVRNNPNVPAYVYATPGSKTVQLIVESDSSCVADTLSKRMMIYGNPVASFASQDSCQGFPVLFTNRSTTAFVPDSVVNFA